MLLKDSASCMTDSFQHPDICRLSMHMVVNTLCKTLYKGQPELVVKILDYVLSLSVPEFPAQKEYMDALKNFEGARLTEVHRIAFSFADYLVVSRTKTFAGLCCQLTQQQDILPDLEARVASMIQSHVDDDRMKWGLRAFLLIIMYATLHRFSPVC